MQGFPSSYWQPRQRRMRHAWIPKWSRAVSYPADEPLPEDVMEDAFPLRETEVRTVNHMANPASYIEDRKAGRVL